MMGATYPRTVHITGSRLTWTDVAGWIDVTERRMGVSPSIHSTPVTQRLHRSLTIDDIRHCDDAQALAALLDLITHVRPACRWMVSEARLRSVQSAARLRLASVRSGRAYARRLQEWAGQPDAAPDNRLRRVLHYNPELLHVEGVRSELRRQELAQ